MIHDDLGKKAERKIREWLDRPKDRYCLDTEYQFKSLLQKSKIQNVYGIIAFCCDIESFITICR